MYGYVDRDGDGWRERPDGPPLVLTLASETDQIYRQYNENWLKSLTAVGIRMQFEPRNGPSTKGGPRRQAADVVPRQHGDVARRAAPFENMYGKSIGQENLARFVRPEFDASTGASATCPMARSARRCSRRPARSSSRTCPAAPRAPDLQRLLVAWIAGYRQPFFRDQSWHFVEVDGERRAKSLA